MLNIQFCAGGCEWKAFPVAVSSMGTMGTKMYPYDVFKTNKCFPLSHMGWEAELSKKYHSETQRFYLYLGGRK